MVERSDRVGNLAVPLAAAAAVLAISSSALLVRFAAAPAVVVAFWRCGLGAVALAPAARNADAKRFRWPIVGAGVALAVHFWAWLASLELTSVAASVTLVTTAPVFVALAERLSGRPLGRQRWGGIALAVAGAAVIAGSDLGRGRDAIVGDALALLAAAAMAAYLLVGSRVRQSLSTAAYASRTYGVAAAVLVVPALLTGDAAPWTWTPTTMAAVAAMTLGPQLAGHTVLNRLLPRLGSVTVSLLLLLEPSAAALLAWLLLDEPPDRSFWVGAPLVVGGLAMSVASGGVGRRDSTSS